MADAKYTFTREYSVEQPKVHKAYLIVENEWNRIKRLIEEIVPYGGGFQVLWSLCLGICGSAIFLLVTLGIEQSKVPNWAWTTAWVAAVASFVAGALSFFVDRAQRKVTSRDTKNVLDEMTLLEQQYATSEELKTGGGTPLEE